MDRQVVVHAEGERGRIHHLEAALDRLEVRHLRQEARVRVVARIAVVDALHAVLGHQDRLGADLEGTEGGRRVGGEERVPGPCCEDHDPPLFEVAHRAAADVGLGDLRDGDRGLDARVGAQSLQRVLQRKGVENRGEHPRVVGGRAIHPLRRDGHAAVEVAAADDDRELRSGAADGNDLARDRQHDAGIDAVVAGAHERLARQLQQRPMEGRRGCLRWPLCCLFRSDAHAPATVTNVNDVTVAPASASAWPTVFDASWIHV